MLSFTHGNPTLLDHTHLSCFLTQLCCSKWVRQIFSNPLWDMAFPSWLGTMRSCNIRISMGLEQRSSLLVSEANGPLVNHEGSMSYGSNEDQWHFFPVALEDLLKANGLHTHCSFRALICLEMFLLLISILVLCTDFMGAKVSIVFHLRISCVLPWPCVSRKCLFYLDLHHSVQVTCISSSHANHCVDFCWLSIICIPMRVEFSEKTEVVSFTTQSYT